MTAFLRVEARECSIQQSLSIIFFDAFQTEFVLFEWFLGYLAPPQTVTEMTSS